MRENTRSILAISFLSIPLSAGFSLMPVLSNLAAAFPEQADWMQLLITLPSLFMMASSLLTDRLSRRTSIRFVTQISILLIAFAGLSPYWMRGFSYLLLSRALMGIGLGLLNTAVASLPALYFGAGKLREHAVGIQSAFLCVGGILFSVLSGAAAKYSWDLVFLVQLINVVPLLAAVFLMPAPKTGPAQEGKRQPLFVKRALPVVGFGFVITALTCTYPLNLSLFVERQGLGSSQFVGLLAGLNSAIGFFIGLLFAAAYAKTRAQTLPLGLGLAVAGLWVAACATHPAALLAGSVCFGIGTSFVSPSLYAALYQRVKGEEVVSSVAMLGIACNVSQFLSPFALNPLARLLSGGGGEAARLIVAGAALLGLVPLAVAAGRRGACDRAA